MCEVLERLRKVGILRASTVAGVAIFIDCGREQLSHCYIRVREVKECAGFGNDRVIEEAEHDVDVRSKTEWHSKFNVGDVGLERNRCNRCFVTTDC